MRLQRPGPVAVVLALLVGVFLLLPLLAVVPISFTPGRLLTLPKGSLSLTHYRTLFENPDWLASILLSARIALFTSVIATGLATSFALGIVSEHYIPQDQHAKVIREARWHLAGYALIAVLSVATGSWIAVKLWLLPMIVMKPVHQLQNTIEHLGLPHVDQITENTRTTRTNALMRWMCWNMQFHTAHHAFPGVPFHRLPDLHRTIFVEKGRKPHSMTYLGFQLAVIKAFWNGRTEADYPDDKIWIMDDTDLEPVGPRAAKRV